MAETHGNNREGQQMQKIMIAIPFANDYLRGENGDPLIFNSMHELLRFFDEMNYTIKDCLQFDYEVA